MRVPMHAEQPRRAGDVAAGFLQGALDENFLGLRQIERQRTGVRRLCSGMAAATVEAPRGTNANARAE